MLQCNKSIRRKGKYFSRRFGGGLCSVAGLLVFLWSATIARPSAQQGGASQSPKLNNAPAGSAVKSFPPKSDKDDFRLTVETDLVVLNATVLDKNSKPITDLTQGDFKVYENNVEQPLKILKREDIPVSVGIIVDNSGSMRDKRKGVNAAALKFVRTSNPRDEVFIVNFND